MTKIKIQLYIDPNLYKWVMGQSYNKFETSDSRAIEKALKDSRDSIFRITK